MTIAATFLDDIVLARDKPEALRAQLARELRRFILCGALVPGPRLPATRICAQRLGVGRNVVTEAYDTLISPAGRGLRDGQCLSNRRHAHAKLHRISRPLLAKVLAGISKQLKNP